MAVNGALTKRISQLVFHMNGSLQLKLAFADCDYAMYAALCTLTGSKTFLLTDCRIHSRCLFAN